MEIHSQILPGGLQLVHAEVADTQMVSLCILYPVGARDEDPDHTGWAHLLEHLMFEGTARVPDYDSRVQFCGGENNAFTNNDFTTFYITVPREHAETAFFLEADRMHGLTLDAQSVEVQKQVVIEEFKQRYLSQPYGDVQHLIRALAYRVHPYRWPAIGITPSHIESATPDALRAFYHRHYRPEGAILAVAGALSWDETLTLAERHFATDASRLADYQTNRLADYQTNRLADNSPATNPSAEHSSDSLNSLTVCQSKKNSLTVCQSKENNLTEPPQQRLRRKTVRRDVPMDMLVMAWHMPDHFSPDFYVCDVITDLLAAGQSGRLAQRLVNEQKRFSSIDAYITGSTDAGLVIVEGRLAPGLSFAEAEAALRAEIRRLQTEPVSDYELDKVRNRFESDRLWSAINPVNVAVSLTQQTLYGAYTDDEIRRYRAVTAADIRRVARQILTRRNCSILHYKKSVHEE
ncbi:MAG: insulinase family protein [Bacteroidaceae bacterium]|nr:insulinase family protein [Bacteroidaceae bacterium]